MRFASAFICALVFVSTAASQPASSVPDRLCAAPPMSERPTRYWRLTAIGEVTGFVPQPSQRDSLLRSLSGRYGYVEVTTEGGGRAVTRGVATIRMPVTDTAGWGQVNVTSVRHVEGSSSRQIPRSSFKMFLSASGTPPDLSLEDEEFSSSDAGRTYHVNEVEANGVISGRWQSSIDETSNSLGYVGVRLSEFQRGYFCFLPFR
jgi:hypothetical protein